LAKRHKEAHASHEPTHIALFSYEDAIGKHKNGNPSPEEKQEETAGLKLPIKPIHVQSLGS
jgi:hypothetical protein